MIWPKLPREIAGIAGPIKIRRPIRLPQVDDWGEWDPETRTILIKSSLPREMAWHTLLHELTHAAHDEAGINLPKRHVEPVADATASGMLQVVRWLLAQQATDGT